MHTKDKYRTIRQCDAAPVVQYKSAENEVEIKLPEFWLFMQRVLGENLELIILKSARNWHLQKKLTEKKKQSLSSKLCNVETINSKKLINNMKC